MCCSLCVLCCRSLVWGDKDKGPARVVAGPDHSRVSVQRGKDGKRLILFKPLGTMLALNGL